MPVNLSYRCRLRCYTRLCQSTGRMSTAGVTGAAQGLSSSFASASAPGAPSNFPPRAASPAPIFLGPHFIADAAAMAAPAVVNITVAKDGLPIPQDHSGTGFIYNADGCILTNAHVVADALPSSEPPHASSSNATSCSNSERQNSSNGASTSHSSIDRTITVALQDGRIFQGSVLMFDRYGVMHQPPCTVRLTHITCQLSGMTQNTVTGLTVRHEAQIR